jgi:hypothetical protein
VLVTSGGRSHAKIQLYLVVEDMVKFLSYHLTLCWSYFPPTARYTLVNRPWIPLREGLPSIVSERGLQRPCKGSGDHGGKTEARMT